MSECYTVGKHFKEDMEVYGLRPTSVTAPPSGFPAEALRGCGGDAHGLWWGYTGVTHIHAQFC